MESKITAELTEGEDWQCLYADGWYICSIWGTASVKGKTVTIRDQGIIAGFFHEVAEVKYRQKGEALVHA